MLKTTQIARSKPRGEIDRVEEKLRRENQFMQARKSAVTLRDSVTAEISQLTSKQVQSQLLKALNAPVRDSDVEKLSWCIRTS